MSRKGGWYDEEDDYYDDDYDYDDGMVRCLAELQKFLTPLTNAMRNKWNKKFASFSSLPSTFASPLNTCFSRDRVRPASVSERRTNTTRTWRPRPLLRREVAGARRGSAVQPVGWLNAPRFDNA